MELLEWDASVYDALPLPHKMWGAKTIERLGLTEKELEIVVGGLTPQQWFADAITHVRDTVSGCPYWACGTQH